MFGPVTDPLYILSLPQSELQSTNGGESQSPSKNASGTANGAATSGTAAAENFDGATAATENSDGATGAAENSNGAATSSTAATADSSDVPAAENSNGAATSSTATTENSDGAAAVASGSSTTSSSKADEGSGAESPEDAAGAKAAESVEGDPTQAEVTVESADCATDKLPDDDVVMENGAAPETTSKVPADNGGKSAADTKEDVETDVVPPPSTVPEKRSVPLLAEGMLVYFCEAHAKFVLPATLDLKGTDASAEDDHEAEVRRRARS